MKLIKTMRLVLGFCFLLASAYMASTTQLYGDMARAFGQISALFLIWLGLDSRVQAGGSTQLSRTVFWLWVILCLGVSAIIMLAPTKGASAIFQVVFLILLAFIPLLIGRLIDKFSTKPATEAVVINH